jgi:methyl-accepting chemotaxis protein
MQLIQAKAQEGANQAADLEENLDQIGRVAGIISNLAAEIQLVAFNATLEAAEAGAAGQRFGVVAAEVKDLATDSIQQARQVGDFLRRVQEAGEIVIRLNGEQVQAVETGASLAVRSGTANQAVIASVSGLAQQASQIQQTTEQQQQASEQIVNAVQEIQAVVDRWVVSSHQMDALVSQLRSLAEQLA